MMSARLAAVLILVAALALPAAPAAAQAVEADDAQPAEADAPPAAQTPAGPDAAPPAKTPLPQKVHNDLRQQWHELQDAFRRAQQQQDHAAAARAVREHMRKVVEIGRAAEQEHPNAEGLADVRHQMLRATMWLQRVAQTPEQHDAAEAQLARIATRLSQSDAAPADRFGADILLTRRAAFHGEAPTAAAPAAIRKLARRYQDTDVAGEATLVAAQLAKEAHADKLLGELVKTLRTKHKDLPNLDALLIKAGIDPFEAELDRLDGGTLHLPKDLKGKVVVLDFWATWCRPCIAEVPHMKKLYAHYKDRGVEFVGISLDRDRKRLRDTIRDRQMNWIHTHSNHPGGNPLAAKFGIQAIPTIWVLGKDGKVFSDNARGRLEQIIQKALRAKPKKDQADKDKTDTEAPDEDASEKPRSGDKDVRKKDATAPDVEDAKTAPDPAEVITKEPVPATPAKPDPADDKPHGQP